MSDGGNDYFAGHLAPEDDGSDYSRHKFIGDQVLGFVRTHVLVKVMAVHANKDNPLLPPTIDVQPLVKQTDGEGNATSHGTVYGLAITRNQGSTFAVINDPVVGDIGSVAIHDRDHSGVIASGQEANPGSLRRFNLADGVYHGAVANKGAPTQYVRFRSDGVDIIDNNGNQWSSSKDGIALKVAGKGLAVTGPITATGNVTAGFGGGDSVTLQDHVHPNTQKPTAGS